MAISVRGVGLSEGGPDPRGPSVSSGECVHTRGPVVRVRACVRTWAAQVCACVCTHVDRSCACVCARGRACACVCGARACAHVWVARGPGGGGARVQTRGRVVHAGVCRPRCVRVCAHAWAGDAQRLVVLPVLKCPCPDLSLSEGGFQDPSGRSSS